jgi:hypothetical protein
VVGADEAGDCGATRAGNFGEVGQALIEKLRSAGRPVGQAEKSHSFEEFI